MESKRGGMRNRFFVSWEVKVGVMGSLSKLSASAFPRFYRLVGKDKTLLSYQTIGSE